MRVATVVVSVVSAMLVACGETPGPRSVTGGNAELGRRLIEQYQCGACHAIPGVAAAGGSVGPSLQGFGKHSYIAGRFANVPDTLVRWLIDPPAHKPGTMMPNLGLSETEARHMAAYLYTLQ